MGGILHGCQCINACPGLGDVEACTFDVADELGIVHPVGGFPKSVKVDFPQSIQIGDHTTLGPEYFLKCPNSEPDLVLTARRDSDDCIKPSSGYLNVLHDFWLTTFAILDRIAVVYAIPNTQCLSPSVTLARGLMISPAWDGSFTQPFLVTHTIAVKIPVVCGGNIYMPNYGDYLYGGFAIRVGPTIVIDRLQWFDVDGSLDPQLPDSFWDGSLFSSWNTSIGDFWWYRCGGGMCDNSGILLGSSIPGYYPFSTYGIDCNNYPPPDVRACKNDLDFNIDLGLTVTNQAVSTAIEGISVSYVHNSCSFVKCPDPATCGFQCTINDGLYGTGNFGVNVFPEAMAVSYPDLLNIEWMAHSTCNRGGWSTANPTISRHPESPGQVALAADCSRLSWAHVSGAPWNNAGNPTVTVSTLPPGGALNGDALNMVYANLNGDVGGTAQLDVQIGYVLSDRRPADINGYIYHLYTSAHVAINIQNDSGGINSLLFSSLIIGPTFRYDKYSVSELLTVGQIANSLSWVPDFNFDKWYCLFAPPYWWEDLGNVCDHSFPPAAWDSSHAKTESGISAMSQYCGQDTDYAACFRGANHLMFDMLAVPSGGSASNTNGFKHGIYCSGGAVCGPL